jgi:signal transduction histidine kinase
VLRQRSILRTGFVLTLGLLLLAMGSAIQVQEHYSQNATEMISRYVRQQRLITDLRRSLWGAGIDARDFFLNRPNSKPSEFLKRQSEARALVNSRLHELEELSLADKQIVGQLRTQFDSLWSTLTRSVPSGVEQGDEYVFIQTQVVPRREAAGSILREIEKASEQSLQESQAEFGRSRRQAALWLLALLAGSLLLGVMVAVVSLRYSDQLERENEERFKEVSAAKQELETLSARLMEIQEEERTRLSRELHDEIVQTLAVSKIEVTQAQAKLQTNTLETAEHLARARALLDQNLRTIRNIALLLRPSLLDDLGLGAALQWLAQDFSKRTGITCTVVERNLPELHAEALNTCVFRVVQEALHNCEKHAQATRIVVDVREDDDRKTLTVAVRDNGIGFDPALETRRPGHMGLVGMRERVAALHGTLTIQSFPGEGTLVLVELPVDPSGQVELRRAAASPGSVQNSEPISSYL